jgi:hypothetical protein
MAATGKAGSIKDSATSQATGALCNGIGIGTNAVYDRVDVGNSPPDTGLEGFVDGDQPAATRIGAGSPPVLEDVVEDADIIFHKADVELDDGDQDAATGFYNHTGQTIKVGQYAWLVENA